VFRSLPIDGCAAHRQASRQSLDSTAALVIEKMRPELDRDAAQHLEGVPEK